MSIKALICAALAATTSLSPLYSNELMFQAKVKEIAAEWHNVNTNEIELEELPEGLSGKPVYLVSLPKGKTVIKEFADAPALARESKALQIIHHLGLTNIQTVQELNQGRFTIQNKEVFLMEQNLANGDSISALIKDKSLTLEDYQKVARGLADLHLASSVEHQVSPNFLKFDWEQLLDVLGKIKALPNKPFDIPFDSWNEITKKIKDQVDRNPGSSSFVHGDPQPENLFIDRIHDTLTTIDNGTLIRSVENEAGIGCAARDYYYFCERADEQLYFAGWRSEDRETFQKAFDETYRKQMGSLKMPSQDAMDYYFVRINLGIIIKNLNNFNSAKTEDKKEQIRVFLKDKIAYMNRFFDEKDHSIRLLSYNIRVDHEQDRSNENKWIRRRDKAVSLIKKHAPLIVTLQEPNEAQVRDLQNDLGDQYEWIIGRSSDLAYDNPENFKSEQHRETQAIAFDKTRFSVINTGRFWLAEDPSKEPSKPAWDGSKYARIALYATLYDVTTEKTLTVLTAHFDHHGLEARINSAHLMVQKAEELSKGTPFIITGDFNTFQTEPGDYSAFREHSSIHDVRESALVQEGPESTWIGWEYNAFNEKAMEILAPGLPSRWDHIFHSAGIGAKRTAVDDTQFEIEWQDTTKNVYPSDHRPIILDFQLK